MPGRKSQEIAAVERVALDERAHLRIDQGPQGFKRVENEAVAVRFVEVKKTDCETGAGCGEHGAEAAGLFRIGKVQHRVDRVCCMTGAGCADTGCTVLEWTSEPCGQDPAGSRGELQALPREPCEGASYGFNPLNDADAPGGHKTEFKILELGQGHSAGHKVMTKFLHHDFTSDRRRASSTLSADKRRVLDRARRHKGQKIAEPSGCDYGNLVVDAKAGGFDRERAAPARKYDRLGLAMVRAGVEVLRYAKRKDFKMASPDAQRRAVAKNENVGARVCLALPVAIGRGVFSGGFGGSARLPLAELAAEMRYAVGKGGVLGVLAPLIDHRCARVFGALHGFPVWYGATLGAGCFVEGHMSIQTP